MSLMMADAPAAAACVGVDAIASITRGAGQKRKQHHSPSAEEEDSTAGAKRAAPAAAQAGGHVAAQQHVACAAAADQQLPAADVRQAAEILQAASAAAAAAQLQEGEQEQPVADARPAASRGQQQRSAACEHAHFAQQVAEAALQQVAAENGGRRLGCVELATLTDAALLQRLMQLLQPVTDSVVALGAGALPNRHAQVRANRADESSQVVTYARMAELFAMGTKDAAAAVGVKQTRFKEIRKAFGIKPWPSRTALSLQEGQAALLDLLQQPHAQLAGQSPALPAAQPPASCADKLPAWMLLFKHAELMLREYPSLNYKKHPAHFIRQNWFKLEYKWNSRRELAKMMG